MKRANLIRGVRDVEGSILCGKVVNHASNSDLKESIIRNSDHSAEDFVLGLKVPGIGSYLGSVGVKVDGWDGGREGIHFSLVGSNLVLQSTEGLQKTLGFRVNF